MPRENTPLVSNSDSTTIDIAPSEEFETPPCYKIILADGISFLALGGLAAVSAGIGAGVSAGINAGINALSPCMPCVGKEILFRFAFTTGLGAGLGASIGASTRQKDDHLRQRGDECGTSEYTYLVTGCGAWQGLGFAVVGGIVALSTNITYDIPTSALVGAVAGTAGLLISTATTAPNNVLTMGRRLFGFYENPDIHQVESEQNRVPYIRPGSGSAGS